MYSLRKYFYLEKSNEVISKDFGTLTNNIALIDVHFVAYTVVCIHVSSPNKVLN